MPGLREFAERHRRPAPGAGERPVVGERGAEIGIFRGLRLPGDEEPVEVVGDREKRQRAELVDRPPLLEEVRIDLVRQEASDLEVGGELQEGGGEVELDDRPAAGIGLADGCGELLELVRGIGSGVEPVLGGVAEPGDQLGSPRFAEPQDRVGSIAVIGGERLRALADGKRQLRLVGEEMNDLGAKRDAVGRRQRERRPATDR